MEPMTFVARCKDFFGYQEGQGIQGFAAELRALTDQDKIELIDLFCKAGMPTTLKKTETP